MNADTVREECAATWWNLNPAGVRVDHTCGREAGHREQLHRCRLHVPADRTGQPNTRLTEPTHA